MYALIISEDGRILSSTYDQYAPAEYPRVEKLPEGDITNYLYINNKYVYSPLPITKTEETPTQLDRIEAQVTYTAMLTDTLLEV